MAAALASLPSIVIVSGTPYWEIMPVLREVRHYPGGLAAIIGV
jgi:hypothetical protein